MSVNLWDEGDEGVGSDDDKLTEMLSYYHAAGKAAELRERIAAQDKRRALLQARLKEAKSNAFWNNWTLRVNTWLVSRRDTNATGRVEWLR